MIKTIQWRTRRLLRTSKHSSIKNTLSTGPLPLTQHLSMSSRGRLERDKVWNLSRPWVLSAIWSKYRDLQCIQHCAYPGEQHLLLARLWHRPEFHPMLQHSDEAVRSTLKNFSSSSAQTSPVSSLTVFHPRAPKFFIDHDVHDLYFNRTQECLFILKNKLNSSPL
jgi:hypothetical protein